LRAYYAAQRYAGLKFAVRKFAGKNRTDKTLTKKQRAQLRAWQEWQYSLGLCPDCGQPCDFNHQKGKLFFYCSKCRDKQVARYCRKQKRNELATPKD
jgi:hypothetical protein